MFVYDVLDALARQNVRYAVVGGLAVNLHGVPRMTYDLDIVVARDRATLAATDAALRSLRLAPRLPFPLEDLADAALRERLRTEKNLVAYTFTDPSMPLHEVDVLVSPPVDVDALLDRAVELRNAEGRTLRVVALGDLVAMKRASGRAQDVADADHLERLLGGRA